MMETVAQAVVGLVISVAVVMVLPYVLVSWWRGSWQ